MRWLPPLIIAAMVATWIVTIVRPSPRLRWAVPAEALILIATHLAGLGWPA